MNDVVFVDTNILVYARDVSEKVKQPIAGEWMQRLWQERRGRISSQVLQEYYVVVTQKLKPGLTREAARADIRYFAAWDPVLPDSALRVGMDHRAAPQSFILGFSHLCSGAPRECRRLAVGRHEARSHNW